MKTSRDASTKETKLAALREIAAHFGVQFDTKSPKKGDKAINNTAANLKKFAGGLAVVFGAKALISGMNQMADSMDMLGKRAQTMGVGIERLQAWEQAASLAGIETTKLSASFRRVQASVLDANRGSKEAVDSFADLGISMDDLANKDPAQQFQLIGEALQGVDDVSTRNAISMKLLGKAGADVNRIFADPKLRENLKLWEDQAPVTDEAAKSAAEYNDMITRLRYTFQRYAVALFQLVVPVITKLGETLEWLTKETYVFETLAVGLGLITAALIPLETAMLGVAAAALKNAAAWALANAPMLLWIAAAALIGLAIEDLITWFNGGESVIGEAIESIFGKGSQDVIRDLWDIITSPLASLNQFWEDIKFIFNGIKDSIMGPIKEAVGYVSKALDNPIVKKVMAAFSSSSTARGFGPGGAGAATASTGGGSTNTMNGGNTVVNVTTTGDPTAIGNAVGNAVGQQNQKQSANFKALVNRP